MKKSKNELKIKWKDSARIKASAADAYKFFEEVRKNNNGELDLDYAVEASRDKNAPLHNELEWNDKKAGHEYRKSQMRYIVRHVEVVKNDDVKGSYRAYESIKVERSDKAKESDESKSVSVYMKTEDILSDPVGRQQLLAQAIRDALAFRRRYNMLSELSKVIEVIDDELVGMM